MTIFRERYERLCWITTITLALTTCALAGNPVPTSIDTQRSTMTFAQIKNMNRAALVRLAADEIRKQDARFDPADFDRVHALGNAQKIVVRFAMSVRYFPPHASDQDLFHAIEVTFTEQGNAIDPEPSEVYKPTPASKQVVATLATAGVLGAADVRDAEIHEEDARYTITVYHPAQGGRSGGTEGYQLDKKTGKVAMTWHEPPAPQTGAPSGALSIGDEDLREIK